MRSDVPRVSLLLRSLMLVAILASAHCGASPITAKRLEAAVAPTFANLVHVQLDRVGLTPVAAADIRVVASCYRPSGAKSGAGDWVCTIIWSGPNGRMLHDRFDVLVTTDGCYSATVDVAEAELGGAIIHTADGRDVRNLLFAFEGCFDTT